MKRLLPFTALLVSFHFVPSPASADAAKVGRFRFVVRPPDEQGEVIQISRQTSDKP